MKNEIFKILEEENLKADMIGCSRHSAAIVHRNKIISIGHNKRKTHPLMLKFQHRSFKILLHAEIDAISKVRNKNLLKDSEMYVSRLSKGNNILNSEPCETCKKAIRFYGINKVYWT